MKALYRKYRPKTLSEVIGQEKVTKILKNAIENKSFSHAYLFTGPRGTGKTSVARIFAHEINDFNYEIEDNYVDIIEIDAASNTGVDNIRDLKERASIAPAIGKYKVYIIDEVHMLSKSAFNALLKILEEPPKHVIFILATTDVQKVPITITSRVQKLVFNLADKETMLNYLKEICKKEKIEIEDDALKIVVKRGGGSFRDSLSLLDQISTLPEERITKELVEKSLGLPQDELINSLLKEYKNNNLDEISKILKNILSSGIKPETLSEEIINLILEKPEKELLPLLSKLPEVKSPFPEAKLLLAFVENFQSPLKIPEKPIVKINSQVSASEATLQTAKPELKESQNEKINIKTFSWEEYKDLVKTSSILLKKQLDKCDYSTADNELHIYPYQSSIQSILKSKNNFEILKKSIKDSEIIIHNFEDKKPSDKSPNKKLNKIDDIMGETQEVKDGEEIPF